MANLRTRLLGTLQASGAFALAGWASRRGLRILCYHGFSIRDEHLFRPKLFIRTSLFEQRMRWLQRHGYEVVSLDEAIANLKAGVIGSKQVVITIDDGFFSVYKCAAPVLQSLGYPATVYVTSYYVDKQTPIFRVCMQYFAWRTARRKFRPRDLGVEGPETVDLDTPEGMDALWAILHRAEDEGSESDRVDLCRRTAELLDVDYAEIESSRRFGLMSRQELAELKAYGIDVQLHTHRHRMPAEQSDVLRELRENRAVLETAVPGPLRHFCYPAGEWSPRHWAPLGELDIASATTCEPGLNWRDTPALALRRFLDADDMPEVEFSAAMSGFKDGMHAAAAWAARNRPPAGAAADR